MSQNANDMYLRRFVFISKNDLHRKKADYEFGV